MIRRLATLLYFLFGRNHLERELDAHEALISIDGREDHRIEVGDVVEVRALDRPIRFVEPEGAMPFWDLLRTKVQLLPS